MSEAANELSLIRKYLLGGLKGEERERLEERVLSDPEFRNMVLTVEENLIEDYTEGALQGVERQEFQMMFFANPQRRLEVQVVEGLRQHAATSWWTRVLRTVHIWKPRDATLAAKGTSSNVMPPHPLSGFGKAAIAFALVVAVAVAFLVLRFWRPEQPPTSITKDQPRRDLIERELARLNNPSNRESLPAAVAATLSPGLSRGDEPPRTIEFPTVTLPSGTESAQLKLWLRPSAQEFRSFQAVLTPIGTPESYKVDLKPVDSSTGVRELVLMLPAHALADGDYRVQLSGQTANGQTEVLPDHYYYFRLVRQ